MKTLSVIGSTGSIGVQTLEVAAERGYRVAGLAAGKNAAALERQILQFRPRVAALRDPQAGKALAEKLSGVCDTRILWGEEGVCRTAALEEAGLVLNAAVGIAGLRPTVAAIEAGKTLALANKESLVCAGELVNRLAAAHGVSILPVDSEHSAIFQCLQGSRGGEVERLILTASGGPFFGMSREQMRHVTKEQALNHPNWSMGAKITIDSASMMNKGLELIEAMWLYDVEPDDIDIVVHRESIVHSAVEFTDGSVIAQMGNPDMRLPIQYALTYPARVPCKVPPLDLPRRHNLTFFAPDEEAFPALGLARRAAAARGNLGAVMNGANEAAVDLFLHDQIPFYRIPELVREAMDAVDYLPEITVEDVLESDRAARDIVHALVK